MIHWGVASLQLPTKQLPALLIDQIEAQHPHMMYTPYEGLYLEVGGVWPEVGGKPLPIIS